MKIQETDNTMPCAGAQDAKYFRRLKWDELVVSGDFIVNDQRRYEPWEGPNGFRADAFLKPIYRRKKRSTRPPLAGAAQSPGTGRRRK